jgi:hypothetical protein
LEAVGMNNEYIQGMEHAFSLITQANKEMINLWINDTFLGWHWWIGVALSIIPWVLWLILRKKESTYRLLFTGLFVILIASWLDILGVLFGLWSYYYNVVPFSPAFVPWDFTLLPVTIMFFLQVKPDIRPIYKAIVFSLLSSFVGEPIFVILDIYNPKHWKYIYSLPIVIAIYLVADWFSKRKAFEKLK